MLNIKGSAEERKKREKVREVLLLLSVSNSDDALALRIPSNVLDFTSDDLNLNLQGMLLLGGIPNAHVSEGV